MGYFQESFDLKVKEDVVGSYGKTLESFKEDVENVKVWLTTQPHLPQVSIDRHIESYLILCKGNVEKVKSKIDMYFTLRARFVDVFKDSHPQSERMKLAGKFMCYVPLPKLSEDLTRILVVKVKEIEDISELDPYACFAHLLNVVDIRFLEDMCRDNIIVFDLEYVTLGHLVKMTLMFLKTIFTFGDKALTTRVAAVHLINAPSYIDQTLLIAKSVIKPKLSERIIVHRDLGSAIKAMDKNILPRDYGGNQKSLAELEAIYFKKFEEHKDFFDQRELWKVDEDLRPEKYKDDGFFGCYGNFKKLDVD